MSSTHYSAQLDEPLVISSVNTDDTTSTSFSTSSTSSSLLSHFKFNFRRYAIALLLTATFFIGLAIGAAAFAQHGTSPVNGDVASTGAASTASPAPTGSQPQPPVNPTSTPSQATSTPVQPTGGRPSGGPGPAPGQSAVTSTANPFIASCTNSTSIIEEGPYFVDERINQADLYPTSPGLQLELTFNVYNTSSTQCVTLPGAWVDIWEANYNGKYSDEASEGTKGLTYLRGYQVTDKNGTVNFRTTYPGYYTGRTVHLHIMVRTFDAAGNVLYRSTTQVYFDDSISDAVFTLAPYNTRPARQTRNQQDRIFSQKAVLPLVGDIKSGYKAAYPVVVPFVR